MESLKPDARFIGRISEALERGRMARSVILFGHSPKCLELTIAAAAKILVGGELLNTFAVWPTGKSRQISLAAIRAVLGKLHLSSLGGGRRVALIHGADRLHQSAANAMLKTLEEPPDGAFFLLSARRRCDVLGTIASRCQPHRCLGCVLPERDGKWSQWLGDYERHSVDCILNPLPRHILERYGLIGRFRRMADRLGEILGGGGECADAVEGDEGGVRRIAMELLFADCSVRLAETAKKFDGDDENWRRVLLLRIGRLIAAVDRAIWLIEKNCPEIAVLESIFPSTAPHGPH